MKKILTFLICALLICAVPIVAFAEDEVIDSVEAEEGALDNSTVTEEEVSEGENSGEETVPETPEETPTEPVETPTEPTLEETLPDVTEEIPTEEPEPELTGPEKIVEYIKTYFEEISVIITLILTLFYNVRKHKLLNKSIGTLNNNAVSVAENSNTAMQEALAKVGGMSSTVDGYKVAMEALLAEIRNNAEEKQKLEDKLAEVDKHLAQSKAANVEFANELAELLVLANIPNAKKDELYARHLAAVDAISAQENATVTEVNTDGIEQTE